MTDVTIPLSPSFIPPADEQMVASLEGAAFTRGGLSAAEIATINDVWATAFRRGWKAGVENTVAVIADGDTGLESVQRV